LAFLIINKKKARPSKLLEVELISNPHITVDTVNEEKKKRRLGSPYQAAG
jgi:hypothetical protein